MGIMGICVLNKYACLTTSPLAKIVDLEERVNAFDLDTLIPVKEAVT